MRIQGAALRADCRVFGKAASFQTIYRGALSRAAKSPQFPPPTTIPAVMWTATIAKAIAAYIRASTNGISAVIASSET